MLSPQNIFLILISVFMAHSPSFCATLLPTFELLLANTDLFTPTILATFVRQNSQRRKIEKKKEPEKEEERNENQKPTQKEVGHIYF